MSDEDRDPLLEVTTSRWHRRSSVICFLVFLVGLLSLVTALLLGYFGFVKSDAIGKSKLTSPYIYALWTMVFTYHVKSLGVKLKRGQMLYKVK